MPSGSKACLQPVQGDENQEGYQRDTGERGRIADNQPPALDHRLEQAGPDPFMKPLSRVCPKPPPVGHMRPASAPPHSMT